MLLEGGAVYRNVPLHRLAHSTKAQPEWTVKDAQTWDCYGWNFSTVEYPYLAASRARAKLSSGLDVPGRYVFTVIPIDDAFSRVPEQAKEFYVVALDNGRYTAQPTNHILIEDISFTREVCWPTFLQRQTATYSAEENHQEVDVLSKRFG